jgi:hypothetical protein
MRLFDPLAIGSQLDPIWTGSIHHNGITGTQISHLKAPLAGS